MPDYASLDRQERRELYRLARRAPGAVAERIHYVRLASLGYSDAQIAELFEVDVRTVRQWLDRFQQGGVEALHDHPDPGRPLS
jgi:transposase